MCSKSDRCLIRARRAIAFSKSFKKCFYPGYIVRIRNYMTLIAPTKFAPRRSIPYRALEGRGVNFKVKFQTLQQFQWLITTILRTRRVQNIK